MLCKLIILAGLSYLSPSKPDGDDPIDTLNIEGIVVNSKLQRYSSSLSLKVIPLIDLKTSKQLVLSDLLSGASNVTINSYGQGGISSASLRGLGSYHTAILWNGINLQSSMNGGVNLTNIPINFIDQLAIQYGGNGALFGSGAIGGTIHLNNSLELGKGYSSEVYQTYGSYNSIFSGVNVAYSGDVFASSTRLFYTESDNDYRYHNITKIGKPYENQVNSNSSKRGLMQNFIWQISGSDKLSASIWVQNSFNRYPPAMTAYSNKEKDINNCFRSVVQWQSSHKKVDFNTKVGYLNDNQQYRNPGISDSSNHYSYSGTIESEAIIKLTQNHRIEAGINICHEQVISTNYPTTKKRTRPAASLTYRYSNIDGKFEFYSGIREEMVDDKTNPITWAIGSRVKLSQQLILRGNISRNYRIPVMNDLYWAGFMSKGNPDLKPEQGYSQEIGLDYLLQNNSYSLVCKVGAFNNNVSNWIIWVQETEWSPINAKKVWARGSDASISFNLENTQKKWHLGIDLMCTYTVSTTEKSSYDSEVGKQLTYIPKLKMGGSIEISYKSIRAKYSQSFCGKRYTTLNNTNHIDPYTTASFCVEKTFEGRSFDLKSFVRIDNIWDEEYQLMAYYPMPLRSYQIGVSIQFNKPLR